MKTLISLLTVGILFTSLTDVAGQALSKGQKRVHVQNKEEYHPAHSYKVSGNDYTFTKATGTYQDLTGAIPINNNQLWDSPDFVIPIGFAFDLNDTLIDSLNVASAQGGSVSSRMGMHYCLIMVFEADLIDRGDISGISQSPISYKLEGSPGNRILKVEWKNAGFFDEGAALGTLNDYVNFQLWLYEGTNAIEIHFGPNQVTDPAINYLGRGGPGIGISGRIGNAITAYYFLSDTPDNPMLVNYSTTLNGTPANGTIYRFSRNTIGISAHPLTTHSLNLYPNPLKSEAVCQTEKDLQDATLTVYSASGQLMRQITHISGKEVRLKRGNLAAGLYLIQLTEQNQLIASEKLIVKD